MHYFLFSILLFASTNFLGQTGSSSLEQIGAKINGCWQTKNYQFKYQVKNGYGYEYKSRIKSSAPLFKLVNKEGRTYLEWFEISGGEHLQEIISLSNNKLILDGGQGKKVKYKRNKTCSSLIK